MGEFFSNTPKLLLLISSLSLSLQKVINALYVHTWSRGTTHIAHKFHGARDTIVLCFPMPKNKWAAMFPLAWTSNRVVVVVYEENYR